MYEPHRSKTGRTTNLASCIVATVFLLFLAAGIVVVYFLLFKPKDPKIVVDAVQFPTFSVANGTVDFTFLQYVTVTVSNPNRDAFTHYDSSLQLAYSDAPVFGLHLDSKFDGSILFKALYLQEKFLKFWESGGDVKHSFNSGFLLLNLGKVGLCVLPVCVVDWKAKALRKFTLKVPSEQYSTEKSNKHIEHYLFLELGNKFSDYNCSKSWTQLRWFG
ncbi:hypothetical protein RJ640_016443 [Escallonia rubra]|uniref:Late embryogenesis abundant protein LEA-2 subgroup domain-containing protein n=1 Tax=Escallonia rubra TaxID=112253 RepID=A0AA88RG35_9ASTE|nr:hypothetical protein RJ640_016443 [Escallonia rubra]